MFYRCEVILEKIFGDHVTHECSIQFEDIAKTEEGKIFNYLWFVIQQKVFRNVSSFIFKTVVRIQLGKISYFRSIPTLTQPNSN